ncbi:MAG: biosynthetic arginine decarboxylase [Myxococcales bacterium]|nr:biosynthetic arginine decarboxylase [Myxococcales bacterium]
MKHITERWKVSDSEELYGIRYWGHRYFNVSEKGEVTVKLKQGDELVDVSMWQIVEGIQFRGLSLPVLLRFRDILDARIALLNESFAKAIAEYEYPGEFRGVYPVKVNQQAEVIKEIIHAGARYHHGLEAGSKAELIATLGFMHDPEALIICNGYKDQEFIDLALTGSKMGLKVVIVIERPGEIDLVLDRARALDATPSIGVRIKLTTRSDGHWTESGGDKSIFGLTPVQVMEVVELLRQRDMLQNLELLHYHQGSQIANIRNIRTALTEATRYYAELVREGARMGYLDIGGGLAVDYDGSKTNYVSSKNYSLEEFCMDVVEVVQSILGESDIPVPTIVSESGRATVAYSSVLLFNVLDVKCIEHEGVPENLSDDVHEYLHNLREVYDNLSIKNVQESFNDALHYRDELHGLFIHGNISLREKALAERLFWHIIREVNNTSKRLKYIPKDLADLDKVLCDIYYANFSIFQSLPDAWAVDQLFPIMPIHRLDEEPRANAVLADITCDSDGKITNFIDLKDVNTSIRLHDLKEDEDYVLGAFLVGAYQETLGDLHNLFGDTHIVNIRLDDSGAIQFEHEIEGDSVADVLSYVEFDPKELVTNFRNLAESAVRNNLITPSERKTAMERYQDGLRGYTYYEAEEGIPLHATLASPRNSVAPTGGSNGNGNGGNGNG